ncbi:hypothetical protein D3C87_2060840 [compost metagenome]
MLGGEFLDDFCGALGIRAVVLDDQFDGPAVDAAFVIDDLDRGIGDALVPATIGGTDAGAVAFEAQADRR